MFSHHSGGLLSCSRLLKRASNRVRGNWLPASSILYLNIFFNIFRYSLHWKWNYFWHTDVKGLWSCRMLWTVVGSLIQTFQDSLLVPSFSVKMFEENAGMWGQGAVYAMCTTPSSSFQYAPPPPQCHGGWVLVPSGWHLVILVSLLHADASRSPFLSTSSSCCSHSPPVIVSTCTVTAQTLYSCDHLSSHCMSSFYILVHHHNLFCQPLSVHTAPVAAFFLYILTLEDRTDMLPQNVTNILVI
jgi:hypothetical protein